MVEARSLVVAFLLAATAISNGQYSLWNDSDLRGRLLTPNEGCGYQPPFSVFLLQFLEHWPWIGSVLTYSPEMRGLTSTCTATLITSRHALTSGNCVNEQVRYLRLGETPKTNTSIIDFRVSRIDLHPKAGWTYSKDNLAIMFLERDVEFDRYSNRFRPACLPMRQSLLDERHGSLVYRLIRNSSFSISHPTTFKTINHTLVENKMCEADRSDPSSDDFGFCAETDGVSGRDGDPIMARVYTKGTFPIYQVGLDTYHTDATPAPILYLYPYIEWINETIIGENTKNIIIIPRLRADELKN